MLYDELSDDLKAGFEAELAKVGIDPKDVVDRIGPDTHPGPGLLSPNPDESTIAAHVVTFDDVDQLKAVHGIPDDQYISGVVESHHPVPDPWPADNTISEGGMLKLAERHSIHQAHLTYLYGDSSTVSSYRDAINATAYPAQVPIYAAKTLAITATNSPFVVAPGDTGHIYGVVTIYQGGQIQFQGNADFKAQKLVKSTDTGPSS